MNYCDFTIIKLLLSIHLMNVPENFLNFGYFLVNSKDEQWSKLLSLNLLFFMKVVIG